VSLILIVDDARPLAEQYAYDLRRLGGHESLLASDGREALDILAREPVDCMLLDLEMPGMDGFEVLRERARRGLTVPVIVYTGTGDFDRCAQAIRAGATSFIDKAETMERVVQEIAQALERRRLESEVAALQKEMGPDALVGSSPAMRKLDEAITRVAPIPSPVLIVGESGSGKEIVARATALTGADSTAFETLLRLRESGEFHGDIVPVYGAYLKALEKVLHALDHHFPKREWQRVKKTGN